MQLFLSHLESPLGDLLLVSDAQQNIRALEFADHKARLHRLLREHYGSTELVDAPAPDEIAQPLARYFSGELDVIKSLPTSGLGSAAPDSGWRQHDLRQTRKAVGLRGPARSHRHRRGQWRQSDRHCRALSSRDRQQWRPQGLCVGFAPKALAARTREGYVCFAGWSADRNAARVLKDPCRAKRRQFAPAHCSPVSLNCLPRGCFKE
jgi:hypothetical protein